MKYISLLIMGILAVALSIPNLMGSVVTIHWYNRRKVSEADAPAYAKAVGFGTLIMGVSIILTAVLQMIFDSENIFYLIIAGITVGLAVIVHAQFKYNRGIF